MVTELLQSKGNIKERMLALNQQRGGGGVNSVMSLGFVLSSLSTLSTPFFQLKTQDKPIPHSFEGKKMREEKKKKCAVSRHTNYFCQISSYLKSGYFLRANKYKSPRNN